MICWEREGRNEKLEIREENRRKDGKEGVIVGRKERIGIEGKKESIEIEGRKERIGAEEEG